MNNLYTILSDIRTAYTGNPLLGLLEGKQLEVDIQVFPNPASDLVRFAVKDAPQRTMCCSYTISKAGC